MSATRIPRSLARTVTDVHGERGRAWLETLPARLMAIAERWNARLGTPFAPLTYSYVTRVSRRGEGAVLKACLPGPETTAEIAALEAFGGQGTVRLLDADAAEGFLLLERVTPGGALAGVTDDEEATRALARVIRALHGGAGAIGPDPPCDAPETESPPAPSPGATRFATTASWSHGFGRFRARTGGGSGPLPERLLAAAEHLSAELHEKPAVSRLLHGDLHHHNVLASTRAEWLAVDPKGVIGEGAYETGACLRNPMPEIARRPDLGRTLARRVDVLAEELGYERRRIAAWGTSQAVLSAIWSIEDHGAGWEAAICCGEALLPLVGK